MYATFILCFVLNYLIKKMIMLFELNGFLFRKKKKKSLKSADAVTPTPCCVPTNVSYSITSPFKRKRNQTNVTRLIWCARLRVKPRQSTIVMYSSDRMHAH